MKVSEKKKSRFRIVSRGKKDHTRRGGPTGRHQGKKNTFSVKKKSLLKYRAGNPGHKRTSRGGGDLEIQDLDGEGGKTESLRFP